MLVAYQCLLKNICGHIINNGNENEMLGN